MVRIGDVWDQTTDLLGAHARRFAALAALAFFLPLAAQGAIKAYGGASPGTAALAALVALAVAVLVIWGVLAAIVMASEPAATRAQAGAAARRRVPAALLVALVAAAAALVAAIPIVVAMAAGGFDFQAAAGRAGSASAPDLSPGAAIFCFFYALLLAAVALWLGARLFLVNAVVALEKRGVGAFGRSFALTRGLTVKLIAVNLLLTLVWAVAAFAARSVVFIIVRLILGPNQIATATWLGSLADAAVTSAFITVVAVFGARLYLTVTGGRAQALPGKPPLPGPWG